MKGLKAYTNKDIDVIYNVMQTSPDKHNVSQSVGDKDQVGVKERIAFINMHNEEKDSV